jgi:CRP/FNR family cyclic AMP-dependent transcriptional regulator
MQSYLIELEEDQVLCREGDPSSEIYMLDSGKLLVCVVNGTQVKALAKIGPGEFIGELSFFDGKPRSTHIIAIEKCTLIQLPQHEIMTKFPTWFQQVGRSLTRKVRLHDKIIHEAQIRRSNDEELKLSIEEQRHYYELLFPKNH